LSCRSRSVATAGIMASLSIAMRLMKHLVIGATQVINFPFMFTLIASAESPCAGLLAGIMSYAVSDIFFGIGPWTAVNSALCGLIGFLWGYMKSNNSNVLFSLSLISEFLFDVANSSILYMLLGLKPMEAIITGVIGLFLPVMGGTMVAIGPITEISTSLGVAMIRPKIRRTINS